MDRSVNRKDRRQKAAKSALAVLLALLLATGVTLAYTSTYQQGPGVTRGEGADNPGGRILDYFTYKSKSDHDKNVAAMSYANEAGEGHSLYARIKLTEYMEQGTGAGDPSTDPSTLTHIPRDATLGDTSHYKTITLDHATDSEFGSLRELTFGDGKSMKFIPTFNHDTTSREVDLRTDATTMESTDIDPYLEKSYGWTDSSGHAITSGYTTSEYYSQDSLVVAADDVVPTGKTNKVTGKNTLDGGIESTAETVHYVKESATTTGVVTLADWSTIANDADKLNKWVYCDDGYFYWSSPIAPEEASGLLLDDVKVLYDKFDWYYAINVEGDFVTPDEIQTAGDAADAKYYWSKSENKEISADVYGFLTDAYDIQWPQSVRGAVFGKDLTAEYTTEAGKADAASYDRRFFDENSLVSINYPARTEGDPGFNEDFYVLDEAYIDGDGNVYQDAAEGRTKARLVTAKYLVLPEASANYTPANENVWETSALRNGWLQKDYLNGILPPTLSSMIPQVKLKTYKTGGDPAADGENPDSYSLTDDKVFLLAAADFTSDMESYGAADRWKPASAYSDATSYRKGIVPKAIAGGLKPTDISSATINAWVPGRSKTSSNCVVDVNNVTGEIATTTSGATFSPSYGAAPVWHRGFCPSFWITAN